MGNTALNISRVCIFIEQGWIYRGVFHLIRLQGREGETLISHWIFAWDHVIFPGLDLEETLPLAGTRLNPRFFWLTVFRYGLFAFGPERTFLTREFWVCSEKWTTRSDKSFKDIIVTNRGWVTVAHHHHFPWLFQRYDTAWHFSLASRLSARWIPNDTLSLYFEIFWN
jgi:hypothetical protein